jgi:sulfate transport system ATP-binding protein
MALARALAVEPRVLLLDEPFGALDARVREELRDWLRRLHEQVHVTTVLVTHDQEEAMEVASRIVVMNHGAVEQAGSPADLYDHPASEFVMGFVGKVNRLGDTFIRPHEVVIRHHHDDAPGVGTPATVERLTNFGYEVRVDLTLPDGERVWARLLPADAADLSLHAGQTVRVDLSRGRMFGGNRVAEPAFA